MAKVGWKFLFFGVVELFCWNCGGASERVSQENVDTVQGSYPAADTIPEAYPAAFYPDLYLPAMQGKRVALVVNQTSTLGKTHLVDTLQTLGVNLVKIFAPEHGFRGGADAGATVADGVDERSGLPIKSLYGKRKQPSGQDLASVDLIVFDIQDVGARFYTYISTLHYVMEAAAEYGVPVMVLDRPNPNGHYVDGPVRQPGYESFVGLDPIPVVHGLTVGEYARMVNGEGWLADDLVADLTVIPCQGNYEPTNAYVLPVPPSPNLPNQRSIYLYPSLCFFEGTAVSVGRGTPHPFQVYGHPRLTEGNYTFTPTAGPGSRYPKLEGQECHGFDYSEVDPWVFRKEELDLNYLLSAYEQLANRGVDFFTRPEFFDKLAGTDQLRKDILAGKTEAEIRATWQDDLADYRRMRERYRLYD